MRSRLAIIYIVASGETALAKFAASDTLKRLVVKRNFMKASLRQTKIAA